MYRMLTYILLITLLTVAFTHVRIIYLLYIYNESNHDTVYLIVSLSCQCVHFSINILQFRGHIVPELFFVPTHQHFVAVILAVYRNTLTYARVRAH